MITSAVLIFRISLEAKTDLFWAPIEDWQGKPVTGRALVTLAEPDNGSTWGAGCDRKCISSFYLSDKYK